MRETMQTLTSTRTATPAAHDAREPDRARSRMAGAPLRVLHCPVNTAGIPWANSLALRRRGVESDLVVFNRYKLHPEADRSLERSGGLVRQQLDTVAGVRSSLLPRYDVFHFYSSVTLVPASVQFRLLHAAGKRGLYHYLGSRHPPQDARAARYGLRADAEIVGSYDAIRWVPHADVVLPGVEVSRIEPALPGDRTPAGDPARTVVAAAQGHRARRRRLRGSRRRPRDRRRPTHDEAFEQYRNADIVVDQLNAGWYGVFAIECLALGKPVVTFLHDEAVRRTEEAYGVEVPLRSATPETLRETLRPLVADAALRRQLGAASRAYAERLHDVDQIAGQLLEIYERVRATSRRDLTHVD